MKVEMEGGNGIGKKKGDEEGRGREGVKGKGRELEVRTPSHIWL